MKRFNVMVRIIDIIEAMTEEEAKAILLRNVEQQGFNVFEPVEDAVLSPDVFEIPVTSA